MSETLEGQRSRIKELHQEHVRGITQLEHASNNLRSDHEHSPSNSEHWIAGNLILSLVNALRFGKCYLPQFKHQVECFIAAMEAH